MITWLRRATLSRLIFSIDDPTCVKGRIHGCQVRTFESTSKCVTPGCVLDRAWTDIEFFISYPDSQLCMATDSSRRWHSINYLGGKFATYSNHWPCFDTQLVVDLFQCECLLLAVSHTTLKCP